VCSFLLPPHEEAEAKTPIVEDVKRRLDRQFPAKATSSPSLLSLG